MHAEQSVGAARSGARVPVRGGLRAGIARFALALMAGTWAGPAAAQSAVVVMYHRFGESAVPSTNIALNQFEAHLAELTSGRYRVLGLPEIVDALRQGRALPDRAVGISVDDAYASLWTEGWPRIKAAGLPLTVFVATDSVDRKVSGFMTWDQLRALKAAGVTIGSQTASHPHMPLHTAAFNAAEIERSNARFKAELGAEPDLFAYPYGEASLAVDAVIRPKFRAAFGQHSGVADSSADLYYLPRFAFNEAFGDFARFRQAINALPLKAVDFTPADPTPGLPNPPPIGFTVTEPKSGLDRLSCFASHEGRLRIERLGDTRFELRLTKPLPPGRTRLNCTLPAGEGRWRWLGRQFYVPPAGPAANASTP